MVDGTGDAYVTKETREALGFYGIVANGEAVLRVEIGVIFVAAAEARKWCGYGST